MIITITKYGLNFFTLLTFLFCSSSFSQNNFTFRQFGEESRNFIKQPAKWKAEDLGKIGIIGLSTYLIMNADEPVRKELTKDQSYYCSLPIEAGRIWGEWYSTGIITGIFALSGIVNRNNSNKRIAYEIAQSFLYTGFVTGLLKVSFGRNRPYMNNGAFRYDLFSLYSYDKSSLPSSHTSTAFSLSTILSQNSNSDLVKVLIYIPALATAFSRMYQDQHWLSDTFLGAAIGYFVGVWVHKIHDAKDQSELVQPNQLICISLPL